MDRRTKPRWWFAIAPVLALGACKAVLGLGDPELLTEDTDGGSTAPTNEAGTPSKVDASCKADLSNDPRNCGRCGHDCGRGTCSARQCQPFVLTKLPSYARHIANDETSLYVAQWGESPVVRVTKASGKDVTTLPLTAGVAALAVDGPVLYWSTYWSSDAGGAYVSVCDLPNCNGSVATRLAHVGSELFGTVKALVGVNGFGGDTAVAWIDVGRGEVAVPGPTSADSKQLATAKTGEVDNIHVVVDTLYWSETGGKLIGSLKRGETVPKRFDIAPYDVADFAIVGDSILFIRSKSGAKGALSRGAIGTTTIDGITDVAEIGNPEQLLVDNDSLFVLADDALRTCSAKDCRSPTVLAAATKNDERFTALSVDETTIWFGAADGTIYGLAK